MSNILSKNKTHTAEPIILEGNTPAKDGMSLLGLDKDDTAIIWEDADAKRFVNCYNAMAGVPEGKEQEAMDAVRQFIQAEYDEMKKIRLPTASPRYIGWLKLAKLLGVEK